MIYSFSQLPKAQREILAAWEWYEDKQIGLGDHFKDAITLSIKRRIKRSSNQRISLLAYLQDF